MEVETLWNDAAILDIKDLMEACVNYMIESVSMSNWWKLLRFSRKENCKPLQTAIMNYINDQYLDCLEDENFKKLKSEEVVFGRIFQTFCTWRFVIITQLLLNVAGNYNIETTSATELPR